MIKHYLAFWSSFFLFHVCYLSCDQFIMMPYSYPIQKCSPFTSKMQKMLGKNPHWAFDHVLPSSFPLLQCMKSVSCWRKAAKWQPSFIQWYRSTYKQSVKQHLNITSNIICNILEQYFLFSEYGPTDVVL